MTPRRLTKPEYSITKPDWEQAEAEYGCCNCGPTALATMLALPVMAVMPHIPNYRERHYTSPTMMKAALQSLGVKFHERFQPGRERTTDHDPKAMAEYGLVRIQWEGPWTAPGANPKWAYRQTHWIGTAILTVPPTRAFFPLVFDVNSGWTSQSEWAIKTVPTLLAMYPRSTGWRTTHRWELDLPVAAPDLEKFGPNPPKPTGQIKS